jgi:predicted permease
MIAFYRALLHLYPASFRSEYGEEMVALFAERLRERPGVWTLLEAIADVIPNALAVHFDILGQDIRYAIRALRRAPGFALTAILVVALGVGANTAAFSLADFVLLRPLPYPDSDRLAKIWQTTPAYGQNELSPAKFRDFRTMTKSFRGMGAYFSNAANLVGEGNPRRLHIAQVTPELLPLVGVPAMLGRVITPADARQETVAVISHELWRSHFNGSTNVIGRTVRLDGTPHTIIGIMPPGFHFPKRDVELWTPLVFTAENYEDRSDTFLQIVGRLAPGVTVEQARAEIATVAARLAQQYPDDDAEASANVIRLRDELPNRTRVLVWALCGAALCILLLACANLASLLLARAVSRTRELAVRAALGAGRERLVRQLITESIALAVLGGIAGVALAAASMPLLAQLVPSGLPIGQQPTLDLRVLTFAAVLIGITGLGFGVAPALRAGTSGALEALRDGERTGGGRRQRMRSVMVILEVTGTVVLLISSGLLMRAFWRIQSVEPGFRADHVMTLRTALPLPKYQNVAPRLRFYQRVLDDVRALPGVENAAYATGLPMAMSGGIWPVAVDNVKTNRDKAGASLRYVTPGFFATLGIPLRRGRDIRDSDTAKQPYVAVISESLAARHWPNQDPIGRRFTVAMNERTVIGVVGDIRVRGRERTSEPQVYLPPGQVDDGAIIGYLPKDLIVRSKLPASSWLPAVRAIIAAADPEQPISDVKPLADIVSDDTAPRLVQLRLLAILSAVALLIAGIGIHGLLSFAVAQRTQELGIRRALGAQGGAIVAMVVREGLRLALAGAVAGVIVAFVLARGMSALLFGIAPGDPQTIVIAVAVCLLTTMVGCLRPALRAARIDPMVALRES